MFQKMLKNSLFRYVFVGGLAYLVDIGMLLLFYYSLHMPRTIAAGLSFWVGFIFAFVCQKYFAFQDYQKEAKAVSKQAFWYGLLVAFNYVFTLVLVSLFPGRYIILSKTLAVATMTLWNYLIYKHIVFRKTSASEPSGQTAD